MVKKLPNNLRALRKSRGFTLKQVAALTNVSLSGAQKHETGERDMDTKVLERYEKLYKVSKNQIVPSTFDKKLTHPPLAPTMLYEHEPAARQVGYLSLYELDSVTGAEIGPNIHKYQRLEPPFPVPVANLQEASFSNEKNLYIIRVFGDSMEPTLNDGCRVVIDAGTTKFNGSGLYAIWDGSSLNIKRLQALSNGLLQLLSDNKNYPTETTPLKDVVIKGRVILIVSKTV
jgi:transcriptional regulator with XRE-family HTH domain